MDDNNFNNLSSIQNINTPNNNVKSTILRLLKFEEFLSQNDWLDKNRGDKTKVNIFSQLRKSFKE